MLCGIAFAETAASQSLPSIQEKTAGMKEYSGYFTFSGTQRKENLAPDR